MIEVEYNGNTYAFCSRDKKGHWIGIRGSRNPMFPGAQVSVPLAFCPALLEKAVSDGHDRKMFYSNKKNKKKSVTRQAEKNPGIKIF
jgi:hypothetical protein